MKETYKTAGTTPDDNQEFGQVGRGVRKGVTCVIGDCDISRGGKNRETSRDIERESCEISDRVVLYAANSRILERNDRAKYRAVVKSLLTKIQSSTDLSRLATEIALIAFPGLDVYQEPEDPYKQN